MATANAGATVCVTGASGFIGSWLVRLLLDRGYTVHAAVKDLGDERETKHLLALDGAEWRLRLFQINLLDAASLVTAIRGTAGVFHLASPCIVDSVEDPEGELLDPAVKGTLNMLRAAKETGIGRVVVTSSICAINRIPGWPDNAIENEECWSDVNYCKQNGLWYPASKTLAERAAWKFAEETGLDMVVINPGMVLGPIIPPIVGASMLMLGRLLEVSICAHGLTMVGWQERSQQGVGSSKQRGGREREITGCTKESADFYMGSVHVKDVALAHILLYENPSATGRHLYVESITLYSDFASKVAELYPEYKIPRLPKDTQPGLMRAQNASKKLIGMGMQFSSMEQIIKDAVESLKSKGYVS